MSRVSCVSSRAQSVTVSPHVYRRCSRTGDFRRGSKKGRSSVLHSRWSLMSLHAVTPGVCACSICDNDSRALAWHENRVRVRSFSWWTRAACAPAIYSGRFFSILKANGTYCFAASPAHVHITSSQCGGFDSDGVSVLVRMCVCVRARVCVCLCICLCMASKGRSLSPG